MKAKRFDIGRQYQGSIGAPAITEQPGGRYVLARDYDALVEQLEAVGSGGVSLMGAQQDADKVDNDVVRIAGIRMEVNKFPPEPLTRQDSDPAMAGDEISDEEIIALSREMLAGKRTANMVAFARKLLARKRVQPAHTLGRSKEDYTRVFNMGRDSVQPASGDAELIAQLREYAADPGYSRSDYADTMRQAADALCRVQPASALDNLQHCPKCLVVFPVQTTIITKAGRAILEASAHLAEPLP